MQYRFRGLDRSLNTGLTLDAGDGWEGCYTNQYLRVGVKQGEKLSEPQTSETVGGVSSLYRLRWCQAGSMEAVAWDHYLHAELTVNCACGEGYANGFDWQLLLLHLDCMF